MGSSGRRILRSTALVMGLTLASKATGLVREIIVAAQFGTSEQMDAFLVATTIAGLMFVWFRSPITVVFIPLFTEQLAKRGERFAWENASILLNSTLILLLMFAGLGWLLSPYLIWFVAPGFGDETKILSVDLTRLMMSTLIFLGFAKLLSAFFYSYQSFGWPGITGTVDNLIVIPSILLLTPLVGIHGLVISTVLGTMAQAVVQIPILWKNRAYYRPRLDLKNPTLRRMLWMSFPLLIATGSTQLATLIDRIFASLLQPGSLSALSYGHRLTYTVFELFVNSLTTVLFPFFSRIAGSKDYDDLGKKLFKSVRTMFWIVFPFSIGILVLHDPLVRLVYHRGAFGEESVRMTGQAVFFYAIGLSASSLSRMLSSAFYSLKDTKTPVVMGVVRLGVKIVLAFSLVGFMGHAGLALAESLSFLLKAALLLLFLPEELRGQLEYREVFQSFGTTAVITAGMGAVVFFILPIFEGISGGSSFVATSIGVGGAVAVGAGAYLTFSLLLQPAEARDLWRVVRSGFAKR